MVFGVPILMTVAFGSLTMRNRAQLWPVIRSIHARLQTDESAKDLFAKNPALANSYTNEKDFLDTVQAWRSKVGELPVQEPPRGPTYLPGSDPGGTGASVQGAGGAWMRVDIRAGAFGEPVQSEGIIRIFFGEDKKALRAARQKSNNVGTQHKWEDFRKVLLQCADDASAAALYRKEPGLHTRFPTEAAFLESLTTLRPVLVKLPLSLEEGAHEFSIHNIHSPFRNSRVSTFRTSNGQELVVTWKDGQLSVLELRPPNPRN